MTTGCAPNIFTAVISLLGVGLGGVIGYFSARMVSTKGAKLAAAARLRASFTPVFARFKSYRIDKTFHDDIEPDAFLRTQLESQGVAVYEFLSFVPKSQWGVYEAAWQQCYQAEKDGVLVSSAHAQEGKDAWSVIEGKIHAVLRFTET